MHPSALDSSDAFDFEVTRELPRVGGWPLEVKLRPRIRFVARGADDFDFEVTRELPRVFDLSDFERTRELPRVPMAMPLVVRSRRSRARKKLVAFAVQLHHALRLAHHRYFTWKPKHGAPLLFSFVAITAFAAAVGFLFGSVAH